MPDHKTYYGLLEKQCLFCSPEHHNQGDLILLYSDNFYLFAPLGAFIEGYIIIASRTCHYKGNKIRSISEIPVEWMDELGFLRGVVSDFYRFTYDNNPGLSFEHGKAGACISISGETQHCYHPHLCCFPVNFPLWDENGFTLGGEYKPDYIEGFHNLRTHVNHAPYLYADFVSINEKLEVGKADREENICKVAVLSEKTKVDSQYLRKILFCKLMDAPLLNKRVTLEKDAWDWRKYPFVDRAKTLVQTFRQWLKNNDRYAVQWPGPGTSNKPPVIAFLNSVVRSTCQGNTIASTKFLRTWMGKEQYGPVGKFLSQLNEDHESRRPKVLDIGCGAGNYLKIFYDLGIEATGIDNCPEMIDIARELVNTPTGALGEVSPTPIPRVLNKSVYELDFEDNSFDGIWCSALVVHMPRVMMPSFLSELNRISQDQSIIYISAQTQQPGSCDLRYEGRVFFYYSDAELQRLFHQAGLVVSQSWEAIVKDGTFGSKGEKIWKHYILKKENRITKNDQTPGVSESAQSKGLGDRENTGTVDAALLNGSLEKRRFLVTEITKCPTPPAWFWKDRNMEAYGRYAVTHGLWNLASKGARPVCGKVLIKAPGEINRNDFDKLIRGASEGVNFLVDFPLEVKRQPASELDCVSYFYGSIAPSDMLHSGNARPGQHLVVLGGIGLFTAGFVAREDSMHLDANSQKALENLINNPPSRILEAGLLAEQHLAACVVTPNSGLISACQHLATLIGRIDIHIDLSDITVDPIVKTVSKASGKDLLKMMLGLGQGQLLCTVEKDALGPLNAAMRTLDCPVHLIGWIGAGSGSLWYHHSRGTTLINDIPNQNNQHDFTNGDAISPILHWIKNSSLIKEEEDVYGMVEQLA